MTERLEDYAAFEVLRIDPYYRTVARRSPETADALNRLIGQLAARRLCLVHGDLPPKNILVAPATRAPDPAATGDLWVIDFEVAHRGDPAFDLAFMTTHLLLKSMALPAASEALDACLVNFAGSYEAHLGNTAPGSRLAALKPDWAYVNQHVGALLLARVKGKSPAGYLDHRAAQAAWGLGTKLLTSKESSLDDLFVLRNEHYHE